MCLYRLIKVSSLYVGTDCTLEVFLVAYDSIFENAFKSLFRLIPGGDSFDTEFSVDGHFFS